MAGRIYDRLTARYGAENVFFDVDAIPFGVNFRAHIAGMVAQCDTMLVVIGRNWLGDAAEGRRRIDDPRDFVRIEVEAALQRGLRVIPVLLGQTPMPPEDSMPEKMQPLAFLNACPVDMGRDFNVHVERLLRSLERVKSAPAPEPPPAAPAPARAPSADPPAPQALPAGKTFRDLPEAPEMVAVPAGSFMMGSPPNEAERSPDEGPQHRVEVKAFAAGKYPVTFQEWDACVADGGCTHRPSDQGGGRGNRPVINVSWNDAQEYVRWLSRRTGRQYRLLSEAEWEYAARAGATTPFHTGETIATDQANFNGSYVYGGSAKGKHRGRTTPVGSFPANAFGLCDMHGNVWEWVEDCWNATYDGAPGDGTAWLTGECSRRILRGGSWDNDPGDVRSAYRVRVVTTNRYINLGFRVARTD
ncbi:MAG: SUMF1/EgtB/PvdO family nonheme iron enzyme [Rhodospirillales bacterium]